MPNAAPPEVNIAKRVYTLAEFRRAGGPCRARCYVLINAGQLHAVKDGRRTVIPAAEVDRYFNSLPVMPRLDAPDREHATAGGRA